MGKHILAGAGFGSNFAMWCDSGYFGPGVENKPLVHLWSLGVEEQFYIAWPLLLGMVWRRRQNLLRITLVLAATSFAVNVSLIRNHPLAAFYSPLSRFWEIRIGGILAYVVLHRPDRLPQRSSLASIAGFLLIASGVLLLNKDKAFPGWWALLPTIGAALVIAAGPNAWLNRNVLGNRAMVWIGLISYPLYLWRWPPLYGAR
jgi:peptidoglycan/LPS O-acetylase OafA/YrhL